MLKNMHYFIQSVRPVYRSSCAIPSVLFLS